MPYKITPPSNISLQEVSATSESWYSIGGTWTYRKEFTVDNTKVPNTNQTNFPVLVSRTDVDLKDISNGGHVGQTSGINLHGIVGPRTRKSLIYEEFITNKDYQFIQDLKYDDRGGEVEQLQTRLRDQNFFPYNISSTG